MMRRGDKIIAVIIVMGIIIGYSWKWYTDYKAKGSSSIATIEVDGKLYDKYDLKKSGNKTIELKLPDSEHSVVEINNGRIRVEEAGCPDKVCVRTGWVSKPGEMIVCIPYKVVIKVSGERQDVDINAF